ncbi:cilia- and flagella-associated protein 251-like [Leptidea sinapis]|uniref:cilia- and flagella-associated protein 251-like n=1 Tax=Leptidea sinapis TaxID=189913 RepID=UPI002121845F|nr:cilia- and flagella-associated protein 251-like [Leptidea sinapis]
MAHSTTKSLQNTVSASNIKAADSEMDLRKMYSLSLSQLRKSSEFGEYYFKPSPFNLHWIYGYNAKAPVINLNNGSSRGVFYAAGNCAVVYDWCTGQMRILQGHKHLVVFLATDAKGSWLVTGDSGPENIIIIWDRTDYFPQKTLFSPHGRTRISKVALSSDAKYLLTLGYQEKATLYWWIWSFGHDTPDATLEVDIPPGGIREMDFNPSNSDQFLLLTKHDIWIGITKKIFIIERGVLKETDDYELKIRCPPRKASTEVGNLTCYTFVKNTSQIIVGSSRGAVLIYGYTLEYQQNVDSSNFENLRFIKVLKIDQKRINVIKNVDGVIVTGNTAGEIFFYDEHMKLLYWVHGFRVDNVKSLSFDMVPRSYQIFDPKCKFIFLYS